MKESEIREFETTRPIMTLFLMIDTSGSMSYNGKIGQVNGAIEEMIPLLQDVSNENADAEIRIAILEFSDSCSWRTNGVQSLETFVWQDCEASGLTEMGAGFIELNSKLSRKEFLKFDTTAYAPVIILLSDGMPTDNWEKGLQKLKQNNWYRHATKIAIAVDDGREDEPMKVLSSFTNSSETVLQVNGDKDRLKKLLSRVSVVSSSMQGQSSTITDQTDEEAVALERGKEAVGAVLDDDEFSDVAVNSFDDDNW